MKIIASNKQAYFNYQIELTFEAGIVLHGSEIKSIRSGDVSIREAYANIKNEEAYIINMNIKNYKYNTISQIDPTRSRKLLLNKKEIVKIKNFIKLENYSLVPLKIYLKHNYAKIAIGLGKPKKLFDKRQSIKKRDEERKMHKY